VQLHQQVCQHGIGEGGSVNVPVTISDKIVDVAVSRTKIALRSNYISMVTEYGALRLL